MLLTLRQAVEATGVSLSTMRRRLRAGEFPNARVDSETGAHLIAVPDLLAAGFTLTKAPGPRDHRDHPGQPRGDQGSDYSMTTPVTTPLDTPEVVVDVTDDEVQRLRAEVAELRDRAARAEVEAARAQAVADERGAALADVRLALRAITAASEQREQHPPAVVVHEVPTNVGMTPMPPTTQALPTDAPPSEPPPRRGLFGRWRQR
ncbi:helix-turn-helix transcriptional regulator [Kineococcus sp. GCM10028916]|uniref:helix-turn-helix transcriptional regulator n=1 Tax=Kineococcus sp. GCM10028916 TaxID=3273394 RepID=UPI00363D0063